MRPKPRIEHESCAVCGGRLENATITHEERRGAKLYLFQNVPAQVCSACGEVWVEESTLLQIERLIKDGEPTSKIETPVYDFPLAEVN